MPALHSVNCLVFLLLSGAMEGSIYDNITAAITSAEGLPKYFVFAIIFWQA